MKHEKPVGVIGKHSSEAVLTSMTDAKPALRALLAHLLQYGSSYDEYRQAEAMTGRLVLRLEQAHGSRFTHQERAHWTSRVKQAIEQRFLEEGLSVLLELAPELVPPQALLDELEQYLAAQQASAALPYPQRYAAVPKEPESLRAFRQDQSYELHDTLRVRAGAHGRNWLHPKELARMEDELFHDFQPRIGPPKRRLAQRSTRIPAASQLVGEEPDLIASSIDRDFGQGLLTRDEVLQRVKVPLVFVEDLRVGTEGRAGFERRTESPTHKEFIRSMAGLLRRLKYGVYAGGVGVPGLFSLADLLAIDGERLLFVECLTDASIRLGGHLKKLELARRVPLCFVGQLPPEFVAELPSSAYAIEHLYVPRMLDGKWVPRFYQSVPEQPARFRICLKRGRKLTRISFDAGLRLPEDVSGFLWVAICEGMFPNWKVVPLPEGWKCKMPRFEIGHLFFNRHGMPDSSLKLKNDKSELILRLGKVPVSAELRGTDAALDLLLSWFSKAGLPFGVEEG